MERLKQLATQYRDGLITRGEYKNATLAQLCIRTDGDWDRIAAIFAGTLISKEMEAPMPQGGGK